MKKIFSLLTLSVIFITGCTATSQQVMPPLQYHQPIKWHVAKNAYINWKVGKQTAGNKALLDSGHGGLIGAAIEGTMAQAMRSSHPEMYEYRYGKAQQAVFMTSFKNILDENHVFKQVELTTEPEKVNPNAVLINVYFKSTRVADEYNNYKITLDVEMTVHSKGEPDFKRAYLVESHPGSTFSQASFKDQQTDVSQQLLQKMLASLQQWQQ